MAWAEQIRAWLSEFSNDPETVRLLFVFVLGVLVFIAGLAISLLVFALTNPLSKRVGALRGTSAGSHSRASEAANAIGRLGGVLQSKEGAKRDSNIARQLQYAGYRSPNALRLFFGFRLLGVVLIPVLIFAATLLVSQGAPQEAFLYAVAGAAVAYVLPDIWLSKRGRKRQERLRKALPDTLDLMVVCTEAGLGLNAAIQRVADEIEIQHPDMSQELQLVNMQTRAGIDSRTAIKELEVRTGVADIRAFVTTLLQSLRFGTSIADTLRIFSDEMRDKRLQRAQEQAAKLGIKMLAPIGLCIFPAFLLVALGPALLGMMKVLSQMR
jgi:tight adherence protein C